jgi:hypothetical protein
MVQPSESRQHIQVLKQGTSTAGKQQQKTVPECIVEKPVEKIVEKPVDRYAHLTFVFLTAAIIAERL